MTQWICTYVHREVADVTTRDDAVYEAAARYYLQDEPMADIAERLGVSRSTVSRLLRTARETGTVQISVRPRVGPSSALARTIEGAFGVTAHVVGVHQETTEVEVLDRVAHTAGRMISGWMEPGAVLGLAWGTTLSAVVRHLVPRRVPGAVVVQLNGAANPVTTGIPYAGSIISAAATAFDARVHHFPVPAFFDYPATKEAMWRERSIRHVLDVQRRADMVVFGAGAMSGPLASHVYKAGYLSRSDLDALRAEGVVGDICTVMLRADGSYSDIELNARATGPTPAELKRLGRRVCVAAGTAKVAPVLAALRTGAVTDLVIDEITALALLDRERGGPVRRWADA